MSDWIKRCCLPATGEKKEKISLLRAMALGAGFEFCGTSEADAEDYATEMVKSTMEEIESALRIAKAHGWVLVYAPLVEDRYRNLFGSDITVEVETAL